MTFEEVRSSLAFWDEETAAVEAFIAQYASMGPVVIFIRDGKEVLRLESSLDGDRSGEAVFTANLVTIEKSSILTDVRFVIEKGRIKNRTIANVGSVFRYIRRVVD